MASLPTTSCGELILLFNPDMKTQYINSDELKEYLRPFARDGTAVSEEDIKGFFSMKAEEMRTGRAPG